MHKRILKFQGRLVALTWVLGIQFLLLPSYHFHPDSVHGHAGKLSPHRHNAHFHSIELESIAHLSHSHNHNSEAEHHHSHHPVGQDEDHLKLEFSKETLKPQKPFKVLEVSENSSFYTFHQQFKTYPFSPKLNDFPDSLFQYQFRERSPPFLSI